MTQKIEDRLFLEYSNCFPAEPEKSDITQCLMSFGFECGDGWLEIIENALKKLSKLNDEGDCTILCQVKSKFGTLRMYTHTSSDEADKILDEAEKFSEVTCEICGKPGKNTCIRGWWTTLCEEHIKEVANA